jgi:hypothetical protein
MKVETDSNGVPYTAYWLAHWDLPIPLSAHLLEIGFRAATVGLDTATRTHPWICASTDGFPARHKLYSIGVNAFATKTEAAAAIRQRMLAELAGIRAHEARVLHALENLATFERTVA